MVRERSVMSTLPPKADRLVTRFSSNYDGARDRGTATDWLTHPVRLHFEFLIGRDYQEKIVRLFGSYHCCRLADYVALLCRQSLLLQPRRRMRSNIQLEQFE